MIEQPYTRLGDHTLPLIPVTLFKKDGLPLQPLLALVDSGASISLFDAQIADVLGISRTEGAKEQVQGIIGAVEVYIHEVHCLIKRYPFPCRIAFAQNFGELQILGRLDFFERFIVLLDEIDQKLYLTPRTQ